MRKPLVILFYQITKNNGFVSGLVFKVIHTETVQFVFTTERSLLDHYDDLKL